MSEQEDGLRPLSASQLEILEEATSSYQAALMQDAVAQQYLLDRGVGREEAVTARLGVVGDPAPGHSRYQGMLAIPYINVKKQVVQIRFRCMAQHEHREFYHGKYNTVTGDPARPYNVPAVVNATSRDIHVAEGEFDAIVLNKLGFNALALPGVKSWKGHFRRMMLGFQNVYIWADPDDAGAEMVQTIMKALPRATPMRLTVGDVSDTYKEGGAEALYEIFNKYRKGNEAYAA